MSIYERLAIICNDKNKSRHLVFQVKYAQVQTLTHYAVIFCVKGIIKYIGFSPLWEALWTVMNSKKTEFATVLPGAIKLKLKNQMATNQVDKCEPGVR